ncbi:DUF2933 domain-containing protein [Halomonas sp. BC04]|uniref:DUF2933 domain-containing protein n=1 Tax=Halomonas sp. BC04 TaxID=1403540 RepID=UPI0003ED7A51|nr:DUF2933 domain-containing protein [Halomonas sp. BC04]EWH03918.1 hypothetical protein Q427_00655 [Halomonas sp. BC04]
MTRPHLVKQHAREEMAQINGDHSNGSQDNKLPQDGHSRLHRWMMTICLVAMGGALLFTVLRGQSLGSGTWLLILPMLLCLGMHFLMHRHGYRHDDD